MSHSANVSPRPPSTDSPGSLPGYVPVPLSENSVDPVEAESDHSGTDRCTSVSNAPVTGLTRCATSRSEPRLHARDHGTVPGTDGVSIMCRKVYDTSGRNVRRHNLLVGFTRTPMPAWAYPLAVCAVQSVRFTRCSRPDSADADFICTRFGSSALVHCKA